MRLEMWDIGTRKKISILWEDRTPCWLFVLIIFTQNRWKSDYYMERMKKLMVLSAISSQCPLIWTNLRLSEKSIVFVWRILHPMKFRAISFK